MNQTLQDLIKHRQDLIPGGAHTYSKGDDQFPAVAPSAIVRGQGAYVWGSDEKKYLDWCMGLRSVSLGHVFPEINEAVKKQMEEGTNFGRPHIMEYVLADRLVNLLPNVEMVKYAKNGSTVTTAATKLARAYTGRKYIAVCVEHPFFSYDDWFIGTTACDSGIPEEIKQLTLRFNYNKIDTLRQLFEQHPTDIACVIMEVITTEEPQENFLIQVQDLCRKYGAVFILDEMITGFRWSLTGATPHYNLTPDLITYGKGIANGYSLAVLGGRKEIMQLGGIKHDKPRVFLISTTHGAETISLAAAFAAIKFMEENKVQEHFWKWGAVLKQGLENLIKQHGLNQNVKVIGFPPNLSMSFADISGIASPVLRTFFLQEVVKRGILFQGYFAISFSHGEKEIETTLHVFDEALGVYRQILDEGGDFAHRLIGESCKPVFRKFN
ncbi:MAG: glutamate-1-semialdehyde 2,1-aminomutase [Patescibacteria group bacterium]